MATTADAVVNAVFDSFVSVRLDWVGIVPNCNQAAVQNLYIARSLLCRPEVQPDVQVHPLEQLADLSTGSGLVCNQFNLIQQSHRFVHLHHWIAVDGLYLGLALIQLLPRSLQFGRRSLELAAHGLVFGIGLGPTEIGRADLQLLFKLLDSDFQGFTL